MFLHILFAADQPTSVLNPDSPLTAHVSPVPEGAQNITPFQLVTKPAQPLTIKPTIIETCIFYLKDPAFMIFQALSQHASILMIIVGTVLLGWTTIQIAIALLAYGFYQWLME